MEWICVGMEWICVDMEWICVGMEWICVDMEWICVDMEWICVDSCKHCSDNSCAVEDGEFVGLRNITGGLNDKTELMSRSLFLSAVRYSDQRFFTLIGSSLL
jgi:hypothetical protein